MFPNTQITLSHKSPNQQLPSITIWLLTWVSLHDFLSSLKVCCFLLLFLSHLLFFLFALLILLPLVLLLGLLVFLTLYLFGVLLGRLWGGWRWFLLAGMLDSLWRRPERRFKNNIKMRTVGRGLWSGTSKTSLTNVGVELITSRLVGRCFFHLFKVEAMWLWGVEDKGWIHGIEKSGTKQWQKKSKSNFWKSSVTCRGMKRQEDLLDKIF